MSGLFVRSESESFRFLADKSRHLICIPYSIANLHKMADQLNIKRCWFHKDHYDIPKLRCSTLLSSGLVDVVSTREIVRIVRGTNQSTSIDGSL